MSKHPAATDATPEELVRAMARRGGPTRQGERVEPSPSAPSFSSEALRESIQDAIRDTRLLIADRMRRYVEVFDGGVENVVRECVDAQDDHQ